MDAQETLRRWAAESRRIVFFGGAGVSTESGIPDFRSTGGLYRQEFDYPPETVLSRTFFEEHPEEFFRFYRSRMLAPEARPNAAHKKLAQWEGEGRLAAVITQNIDGLHQAAGSQNVLELHGSVHRNHCIKCGKFYGLDYILHGTGVPHCEACGGIIKPDVVLYEEPLDDGTLMRSVEAIANADLLLVGGTSLSVYPAAGLLNYYSGRRLALINRDPTPYDRRADLLIQGSIGAVLGGLD
jgi:NAD-dependent deacetylase